MDLCQNMKKRKKILNQPISFSNMGWFIGYGNKDMIQLAAMNRLPCICCIATTPITSTVWFYSKDIYYA